MQSVFRPNLILWLWRNPAVPVFLALAVLLLLVDKFSMPAIVIAFIVCAVTLLALQRAGHNFISIDNRQISGRFQGQTFRVMWWDIRAAWLDTHSEDNPVLMLGTDRILFAIPTRYMPAATIWEMTQARVIPAALHETARQELPYWQPVNQASIPELEEPLVLRGRALEKVIGWVGLIFFDGLFLAFYSALSIGLALVLAGFILFSCVYLLSAYYSLQVGPLGITHQMVFGQFFIAWDEVKSVHIAQDGSTVQFQGGAKRILVYGPKTWGKTSREDVMQYIGIQLEARQIHVKVDPWAGLRMAFSNRAARVKNPARESS